MKRKRKNKFKNIFDFLLGVSQLGLFISIILFLISGFGGNISGFWFEVMVISFYVGILSLLNLGWLLILELFKPILENQK